MCVELIESLVKKSVSKQKPSQVFIELTYRCNLQCEHCFLSGVESDELKTEEFITIFKKLRNWGVLFVGFTGGEIFTRGDLLYLLEKARNIGLFFHLQTNGTLITREVAEELKKVNPTKVEISLYGAKEATHDAITQVPGSFQRSLEALRRLKELGVNAVIKTSVMKKNLKEIKDIRRIAERLKAGFSADPLIAPRIDGKIPSGCRLSDGEMVSYLKSLSWENEPEERSLENQLICGAGKSRFSIAPDGTVYPCILLRFPLGNAAREDFEILWKSEEWRRIRNIKVEDLKICPECSYLWECARCPGFAYLETGDFLGPSPENCRLAEKVREVRLVEEKALH
jgi:radical SAM protein with 4Fe4S-binding SPASM domain